MINKAKLVATMKWKIEELQDKMQAFIAMMDEAIDTMKHAIQFQEYYLECGVTEDFGGQAQLPHDKPMVPKGREFTLLPAAMSIIWPILLRKGEIQQEQAFPWLENTLNFDLGKFCDFHCG